MTNSTISHYVCYYRVSTQRQGESGLGLEAQQLAVARFIAAHPGEVLGEYTETESGKKSNRVQLTAALDHCRRKKATLLIAKLDRLARNVYFLSGLMESGVDFLAADQPTKDRFWLHLQAAFAEEEARRISLRTKEALAAAKARGVVLGATGKAKALRYQGEAKERAEDYRKVLTGLWESGCRGRRAMRDTLNAQAVPSPGGGRWHLPNLQRTLGRLGFLERA